MQKEFRHDLYVSIGAVLGAFLFAGVALTWLNHSLFEGTVHIVEQRFAIAQYSQTIDLLANLKKVAPLIASYQSKMNLLLSNEDDSLLELRPWIDGVSRTNRVAMEEFSFQGPGVPVKDAEAGYRSFTLSVAGPLDALTQFFREIELHSSKFLVSIDSLDVNQVEVARARLCKGECFLGS